MKIYKNPQELTPNQKKWMNRYLELSGDELKYYTEPISKYHEVYEWDNGWIDYRTFLEQRAVYDKNGQLV